MTYVTPLVRQYRNNVIIGSTNAIARGAAQSMTQLPEVVEQLGNTLRRRGLPRAKMKALNLEIARVGQQAVVSGWRSRLPRNAGGGTGRYAGTLGPALANPAMLEGTSDRVISFINGDVLDQEAAHWYRINYGAAGPNYSSPNAQRADTFVINLNGRPFITLRDDRPPDPTTFFPRQFFWTESNRLVVTGPGVVQTNAGAAPAHFIDLGLQAVAEVFPVAYDAFFRDWLRDAKSQARVRPHNRVTVSDLRVSSYGWSVTTH